MTFTNFEAEPESLYDLVSKNGRGLYIPPYQRDYSWDDEKVDRLISDLFQSIKNFIAKEERSTFLGTIIVLEGKAKEIIDPQYKRQAYADVLSIIDGQQRLTTLLVVSLILVVNIDIRWKKLIENTSENSNYESINNWIEESVNILRGNVKKIIFEEQNNGEDTYKYFPKMIRSYVDQWSYQKENAKYVSPIAWLLFEYIKFDQFSDQEKKWEKYVHSLEKSLTDSPNKEKAHILKVFKRLNKSISNLTQRTEDELEFPNLKEWVNNKRSQEHFFEEEFPSELVNIIELDEDKDYLELVLGILSTLAFTKFVINNIALIVVVVKDEDYAFDIFEALNSTGQPLTAIETFTPTIVKEVGIENYKDSTQKKMIDNISMYLKDFSTQNKKQGAAKDIVISFALAEKGEKVGNNLSEQRSFMKNAFNSSENMEGFLENLLSISKFYQNFWIKDFKKPKFSNQEFNLDNESELCLQFLIALKHTITIPLLSQYMMAVEMGPVETRIAALKEFENVIKAVATFTTLWRSMKPSTDGIDKIYRSIMSTGLEEVIQPVARQKRNELPSSKQVEAYFKRKLEEEREISSYEDWKNSVINVPIYSYSQVVTKFILLVSMNDCVQKESEPLKLETGKIGTFPTLDPTSWHNENFETIEHIVPQNPENKIDWASSVLDDKNVKHQFGNLILIPKDSNSSIKNKNWEIKSKLYKALSSNTKEQAQKSINELNSEHKLNFSLDIYSGTYLPHINVLTGYSTIDSNFIKTRGTEVVKFASLTFQKWLDIDKK